MNSAENSVSFHRKMPNYTVFCESFKEQYQIIGRSSVEIYIAIFVVNIVMSISAIFGNSLIIDALRRCSSLHSPSKALLLSLALSDLGVGCIAQPLFVVHRFTAFTRNYRIYCIAGIGSNFVGSTVVVASFLTNTAIAVDRFLALRLRFRYREVVTLKRVIAVLIASWFASMLWSALWFWDKKVQDILRLVLFTICMLTTSSSYLTIYKRIRRSHFCVSQHVSSAMVPRVCSFNMLRFRRSVTSMCYIYCFLLACYLPYTGLIVFINRFQLSPLTVALNSAFCSLLFLNSAINPLVLCQRISEIREIVRSTLFL